ncbi:hypothetical protein FS837_000688 [Tulasnella sp. UAMH 9824]|nr:hypothetical protein FS837_000688 [Tulasnella sp. UAMH 9824]
MQGQAIEAWYSMFVNDSIPENRRFRWVTGMPGATKESRKKAKTSRKAKETTQSTASYPSTARRTVGDDVSSSEDENPLDYQGESETSAGEGPSEPRLRAPTISKKGRISSAPQILAPLNSSRKRPAAYVHVDPVVDATPKDTAETAKDPESRTTNPTATDVSEPRSAVRPLPEAERPPQTTASTASGILTSPQKVPSAPAAATDLSLSFKFHPPNDHYPTHLPPQAIEQANSAEYFRHIPSPHLNGINGIVLPHLADLIICCVDLDVLFPLETTDNQSSGQTLPGQPINPIDTLWMILQNPEKPLPTYLFALGLCRKSDESFSSAVLPRALDHLSAQIEALEGCNMCTMELGCVPVFESWTASIIITTRFLSFLYSIPQKELGLDASAKLDTHNERLVEIVCMYLVFRYTASTVSGFISSHPNATSPPTIASSVKTLGIAWLNSTSTLFNPLNKRRLSCTIGHDGPKEIQHIRPRQEPPFFELHDPAKRWLGFEPTGSWEDAMIEFALQVNRKTQVLERLSTYEQFILIAAIIVLTTSPKRETGDADWLVVVESMVVALEESRGTSKAYEQEYAPIPPPPTMAQPINSGSNSLPPSPRPSPSVPPEPAVRQSLGQRTPMPDAIQNHPLNDTAPLPSTSSQSDDRDPAAPKRKSYIRPNPRASGRTKWAVGDVIKFAVGGATREVRIRQKGPDPSSLVLTWLRSRKPVLSKNGAPIPLPPFDKDLLITPGPLMPALDLDCFIRDQPLPPFIPFEEILSGVHEEYFRQLFAEYPDDPPLSSESEGDEIDDLSDDLRLRALNERIDRRRLFRDQLGLPPSAQDLQDEADVQSILGSSSRGPIPPTGPAAEPGSSVHEANEPSSHKMSSTAAQPRSDQGSRQPGDPSSNLPEGSSVGNADSRGKRGKRKRNAPIAPGETGDEITTQDESSTLRPEVSPPVLAPRKSPRTKNPPTVPAISVPSNGAVDSQDETVPSVPGPQGALLPETFEGEAEGARKKGGSAAKGKAKVGKRGPVNAGQKGQDSNAAIKTRSKSKGTSVQAQEESEEPPAKRTRSKA